MQSNTPHPLLQSCYISAEKNYLDLTIIWTFLALLYYHFSLFLLSWHWYFFPLHPEHSYWGCKHTEIGNPEVEGNPAESYKRQNRLGEFGVQAGSNSPFAQLLGVLLSLAEVPPPISNTSGMFPYSNVQS